MADGKKSSIKSKLTCHLVNIKSPAQAKKRLKNGFRRVYGSVRTLKTSHVVRVATTFIDITEAGFSFFSTELLLKGASVEVYVSEPQLMKVTGVVAWSVPIDSGMNPPTYPYRGEVQFIYANELERAVVMEYCQKAELDVAEQASVRSAPREMPSNATEDKPENPVDNINTETNTEEKKAA